MNVKSKVITINLDDPDRIAESQNNNYDVEHIGLSTIRMPR